MLNKFFSSFLFIYTFMMVHGNAMEPPFEEESGAKIVSPLEQGIELRLEDLYTEKELRNLIINVHFQEYVGAREYKNHVEQELKAFNLKHEYILQASPKSLEKDISEYYINDIFSQYSRLKTREEEAGGRAERAKICFMKIKEELNVINKKIEQYETYLDLLQTPLPDF